MTNVAPHNPFNDEDGYYPHDPKSALTRTDEQFRAFVAHLQALGAGVEAVSKVIPAEKQELVEVIRAELGAVQGNTKLFMALVRELAAYNMQLTQQRQSARDAYNAGWEERYQDILSQLHPADQRMLRWIVEHLPADATDMAANDTPY